MCVGKRKTEEGEKRREGRRVEGGEKEGKRGKGGERERREKEGEGGERRDKSVNEELTETHAEADLTPSWFLIA